VRKSSIGDRCNAIKFADINQTDDQPMPTQSNKLDFSNQNVYVGFDVHLKDWKVSIMVDDIHHKTFSQNPSPEALYRYLDSNFPSANYYSAYEAGFSGFWIHYELEKLGVHSIVVNPSDIPTTGKEAMQKEDRRDSLKIVKSLRGGLLNPIYVPDPKSVENRALLRSRTALVRDLARVKNRLKGYLRFIGITIPKEFERQSKSWTKSYLEWLQGLEISESAKNPILIHIEQGVKINEMKKAVTRQLKSLAETPDYQKNFNLLRSVPGIGLINSFIFLFELDKVERFKKIDNFCSFLGLIPSTHSSGEKERTGDITPRSNRILRQALIESAWVAIRRDPVLMKKFMTLRQRMKENRAIVRIAKSLAGRIYFVLKKQVPYQLGHTK
jgi:transposase